MAGSDGCAGNSAPGSDIEGLSFVVGPDLGGQRVDQALAELCGVPRAKVSRWITRGPEFVSMARPWSERVAGCGKATTWKPIRRKPPKRA